MSVQELYVEWIIQINITICKSYWKVLLSAMQKYQLRGFTLALFKCQTCTLRKSQGTLISHWFSRDLSLKTYARYSGCTLGSVHRAGAWLCFRLGRDGQGDDNGVLSLELAGKHFWGALWAVRHRACCCTRDKFCSRLQRHNFGWFLKHEHLISVWLIDFNGVYSYNFYNGVSESRIWPVAVGRES